MILISHRGNLEGPNPERENNPEYILEAIKQNYMVEVDLRMFNGELMLGHDESQYEIDHDFLIKYKTFLWVHCKDALSLDFMSKVRTNNYFWHQNDDYTLTSWNYVWAYPGKSSVGNLCVMVMPELHWPIEIIKDFNCFGVCSDYVSYLKV